MHSIKGLEEQIQFYWISAHCLQASQLLLQWILSGIFSDNDFSVAQSVHFTIRHLCQLSKSHLHNWRLLGVLSDNFSAFMIFDAPHCALLDCGSITSWKGSSTVLVTVPSTHLSPCMEQPSQIIVLSILPADIWPYFWSIFVHGQFFHELSNHWWKFKCCQNLVFKEPEVS